MKDYRKNYSGIRKLSFNIVSYERYFFKEYNYVFYKKLIDNVCFKNYVIVNKNVFLVFLENLYLIKMYLNCEKMLGNY